VRGLSQEQLADAAGTYRTHVVKWETGHYVPSDGSLGRLAEALSVPVFYFYIDGPLSDAVEVLRELLEAGLQ
jgi:transcriptional regulator with XRE-family HTH domain